LQNDFRVFKEAFESFGDCWGNLVFFVFFSFTVLHRYYVVVRVKKGLFDFYGFRFRVEDYVEHGFKGSFVAERFWNVASKPWLPNLKLCRHMPLQCPRGFDDAVVKVGFCG